MNKGFIKLGVFLGVILVFAGVIGYLVSARNVEAFEKSPVCHFDGESGNFQTLWLPQVAVDLHILAHSKDYEGECQLPKPSVRLTSMCYEGEGKGLMRFREEGGGDYTIVWEDNDGNSGEFKAGETVFFDVTSPKTIIVKWYVKEYPDVKGQTVKAQNTKECEVITICLKGETVDWIKDKPLPEGAYEGECRIDVTPTPEPERPTTPAGAPQCTDSTPLVLPSNVHVVRSGADATVNFFTSSKNANIYFKEVNSSSWQHAVRDISVTGGYVSYTIHDLNPALGYTFGVQAANSCAGGETVLAVVVDGPQSFTFPLSFWEWLK